MQKYTEIENSNTIRESRGLLLDNDKTAISCNSGTVFPASHLQVGMLCYRTDEKKLYELREITPATGTTPETPVWKEICDLNRSAAYLDNPVFSGTPKVGENKIWHAGNDGSGSGLDADVLRGFAPSTSASINTIAQRDGSGDVHARLLRQTHTGGSTTFGHMLVQNDTGTDNYARPATIEQVKDRLNVFERSGGQLSGQLELGSSRTRISGLDEVGNHIVRHGTDDTDWMLKIKRKGVSNYNLEIANDGESRELLHLSEEKSILVETDGWYTIAEAASGRAFGEFFVYDTDSGRHNMHNIRALTAYGQSQMTQITGAYYGLQTISQFRIFYNKADRTYGGAKLQVWCKNAPMTLRVKMSLGNQLPGWSLWKLNTPPLRESLYTDWASDTYLIPYTADHFSSMQTTGKIRSENGSMVWSTNSLNGGARDGYMKLGSNLIMQWGYFWNYHTGGAGTVKHYKLYLPIMFPNANRNVIIGNENANEGSELILSAYERTKGSFKVEARRVSGSNSSGSETFGLSYIAIGH